MDSNDSSYLPRLQREDFTYPLPDARIARFPLSPRDSSKLMVWKNGAISHTVFNKLPELLPKNSLLIFNNTKVIPARLIFNTETGANVEVFLLSPVLPYSEMQYAMSATGSSVWQCTIGNKRKWKDGQALSLEHTFPPASNAEASETLLLDAILSDSDKQEVTLSWSPSHLSLAEVIQRLGRIPLPPYLKRDAIAADAGDYQTVYSSIQGAVAAPTAGLHFTPQLLDILQSKGFDSTEITLHVGAGTFKPLKAEDVRLHDMHAEQYTVTRETLVRLLSHEGPVIPVGTTSLRLLESLYWAGSGLLLEHANAEPGSLSFISKEQAYRMQAEYEGMLPEPKQVWQRLLDEMDRVETNMLSGSTGIFIMPGYKIRTAQGLITNFHQPESTLILLVAALAGNAWKKIYWEALAKDYRFLSYGDSSLLLPD
ncbi:MAG: S-adenosylmethionine:tRNA ribosyltransferase-isomerase [Bacteroidota bacterium]